METLHKNPVPPYLLPPEEPTVSGIYGRAWRIDLDAYMAANYPDDPKKTAAIVMWIVHAPGAHPFWHTYLINVIHLRDVPGLDPAAVFLPGATHEVIVFALDPRHPVRLLESQHRLTPVNFVGQWVAGDDAAAREYTAQTVMDIVDGRLSPDTDYLRDWVARFSDSHVLRTGE